MMKLVVLTSLAAFTACSTPPPVHGVSTSRSLAESGHPVHLHADVSKGPYQQIRSILASDPETPDCGHQEFGPHITQQMDEELGHPVFSFQLHVHPDGDRCLNQDRQRVEIKTMGDVSTPDYLKGFRGDTVSFRWKFKLPSGFQPSYSFTHLHQLKAFDGDADLPLLTLTARKGVRNVFQIIHINSNNGTTFLISQAPLDPLIGVWIEAYEKVTYGPSGSYDLVLRRVSDGKILLNHSSPRLDLWRNGTTVVRPKWGIYRSLQDAEQLRDEAVSFDDFCLAKSPDDC